MKKQNFLYFAENEGNDAVGDSVVIPTSNILGMSAGAAGTTILYFSALNGTLVDDNVVINHPAGKHAEVCEALVEIINSNTTDMIVCIDEDNSIVHPRLIDAGVSATSTNITLTGI
jgi:hypothetical protein